MSRPTDQEVVAWYPRLYRTALRMTGCMEQAADLTQEVFCRALANWRQFDGQSLPTTWLHQILTNAVRDHFRRSRIRQTVTFDEWSLNGLADGSHSPGTTLEKQEELEQLRRAIDDLSDDLRRAFIATTLDGYSYQEAAELLQVPVGTIASRLHEARRRLRQHVLLALPED